MVTAAVLLAGVLGPSYRTSVIDVTPPELLPLGGYTARKDQPAEEGGEPLWARTVVFEGEGTKVAVVSFEALTVPESLVAAVRSRIPADVRLFLVATHTHSAPDSQMLNERMTFKVPGIATFQRRWLDWYAGRIAKGIETALAGDPIAATKLFLSSSEVDANRTRRNGPTPIKTATFVSDGTAPLLTVYAAHGTVVGDDSFKTNGDWPGLYSKNVGGLLLPGPIGDVSPTVPEVSSVDNRAFVVDKLSEGFRRSARTGLFDKNPQVAFVQEKVELEKPVPHPEFSKSFGAPEALAQVLVQRFAPPAAEVTIVQLGSLLLVGVPGEPTTEVGRKVQVLANSLGFPHTVVVSHTNGWIGYVLTAEDYGKGGYEATLAFHGPAAAERVVAAVGRGLKKLAQTPRVAQTR